MDVTETICDIISRLDARNAGDTPVETGVSGLNMVRSTAPTPLRSSVMKPLVCLVLQGAKESVLGHNIYRYAAGETIVVSMHLPVRSRIVEASREAPYVALSLFLDYAITRNLLAELAALDAENTDENVISHGTSSPALTDALLKLYALSLEDDAEQRILAPLLIREIHFRLLRSPQSGMLRQIAAGTSHAGRINRVVAEIRRCFTQSLNIAELADIAGMSPSSFHEHFKQITQTTPLQYQKDMRLLEARTLLLAGDKSVSSVAFAVGYESPTQFSRDYTRKFGHNPSQEAVSA